jgi:hypothetical protein
MNPAQILPVPAHCWYNTAHATVAQMAEQAFRKRQVMGSIPIGGLVP